MIERASGRPPKGRILTRTGVAVLLGLALGGAAALALMLLAGWQ